MKAYKFKIKRPSRAVVERFEQTLEVSRELYNAALQERRDAWRVCRKSISLYDQQKELTEIRAALPEIKAVPMSITRDPLRRVDEAFKAFFRRTRNGQKGGYPRFKSKSRYNSFTYVDGGFKLKGAKLELFRIGSVRLRLSRLIEGEIKTCTVRRQVDGWFVIFKVEENYLPYIPKTGASVGVDVGLDHFAALSTGELIQNPCSTKEVDRDLNRAHRAVTRKKRGGANHRKAVQLLATKYQEAKDRRRDFFHKLALYLIRRYDHIAIENLRIENLRKNHHVAKSISDAAWGTFFVILESKAASAGRRVWRVSPQFTSQDCSKCGARARKSLSEREHRCINPACGYVAHRDVNAAVNIKGRAVPLGMGEVTNPDEPRIPMLKHGGCQMKVSRPIGGRNSRKKLPVGSQ